MSDVPRGEGWWQASDGRFYPPELHPSRTAPVQQPAPAATAADPGASWFTGAATAPDMGRPGLPAAGQRERRPWAFVIIGAAVLLVVVGVIVAITSGGSSSGPSASGGSSSGPTASGGSANGVGTAAGTYRITWQMAPNGAGQSNPQPFSGSIGGKPVQGVAQPPSFASGGSGTVQTLPSHIVFSTWSGTYENKTFHLQVTLATSTSASALEFDVSGTYGTERVSAVAKPDLRTQKFTFSGTVGASHVSGTVSNVVRTGNTEVATGTFSVQ